MSFKVAHIEQLLLSLAKKTKQSLDHRGFQIMSDQIQAKVKDADPVDKRYLYEALYRNVADAKKEGLLELNPRLNKLDQVAQFLDYKNFLEFTYTLETPLDPVLKGCVGAYNCYLRRNTEQEVILSSPVRIFETAEKQVVFELRGPDQTYSGSVVFKSNCLFILMQAPNGKEFHHVYRIGQKQQPKVLQGIFSGVSTAFEPIGGRVLLIRSDNNYDLLKNRSIVLTALRQSLDLPDRRIAEYFSNYADNNLSLLKSMTFGIDDLGSCT
jgi:hypothetical protein